MRIVVLAGPPCSGKTTLAHTVAGELDVVIDYDTIAQHLGSPVQWIHPEPWQSDAEAELQRQATQALHHHSTGTAWVIRTAPRPQHRARLAQQWHAEVYLINPGERECVRRARADARPTGTARSIGLWYHRYTPWSQDLNPADLDPRWAGITAAQRGVVMLDPRDV